MYWIVTESTCDFPKAYVDAQENFHLMHMTFTMDGQVHTPDGTDENSRDIYAQLRGGKMISTSQINTDEWIKGFEPILAGGDDILAIVFSSGLSGTYMSAVAAADELRAKYPDRKLELIDSLCASAGEGLLVHYALENRKSGKTLEENAKWIRSNVQNVIHWFTVDDLHFLRRGGRLSAAGAYLGSLLMIKPVLHVDHEGHLIPMEKVQGRKRSLKALASKVKQLAVKPEEQTVFISHGDCLDEAQYVADLIRKEAGVKQVQLSYIGPIIGSHSGPGTIAIFFMGKGR